MNPSPILHRLLSSAVPSATGATIPLRLFTIPPLKLSSNRSSNHLHLQTRRRPLSQTPSTLSSTPPFRLTSHAPRDQNEPSPILAPGEYYSPYKPKRQWPPDMTKLSPKHQFRLERKYRRRAALKYARPKWSKATKLVQWGSIFFVLLYALLFMEWDQRGSPFEEIRKFVFAGVKGAFSTPPPPVPVRRSTEDSTGRE